MQAPVGGLGIALSSPPQIYAGSSVTVDLTLTTGMTRKCDRENKCLFTHLCVGSKENCKRHFPQKPQNRTCTSTQTTSTFKRENLKRPKKNFSAPGFVHEHSERALRQCCYGIRFAGTYVTFRVEYGDGTFHVLPACDPINSYLCTTQHTHTYRYAYVVPFVQLFLWSLLLARACTYVRLRAHTRMCSVRRRNLRCPRAAALRRAPCREISSAHCLVPTN